MLRNNFEFSVLVKGSSIKEYEHNGATFIEGKEGTEFSLRLKNNTHQRCLAVITVDGKSVIDGTPGSVDDGGGYVVNAYSSVTIPGWRLDDSQVAKFVFSDKEDSYAVAAGDGDDNVGVIGCAVFFEKQLVIYPYSFPTYQPARSSAGNLDPWITTTGGTSPKFDDLNIVYDNKVTLSSNSNINANANDVTINTLSEDSVQCCCNAVAGNLGTGFGEASEHSVTTTSFNRCDEPNTLFTTYYDNREGLEARGVNLKAKAQVCPSPFPASRGRGCPPPPSWGGSKEKKPMDTKNMKGTNLDRLEDPSVIQAVTSPQAESRLNQYEKEGLVGKQGKPSPMKQMKKKESTRKIVDMQGKARVALDKTPDANTGLNDHELLEQIRNKLGKDAYEQLLKTFDATNKVMTAPKKGNGDIISANRKCRHS